jgi:hypothetical protein
MSGLMKPPFGARLKLDHPLARGLVSAWLFNEGSGNKAYDSSGQGNHGTLTGMNDPPVATSGWNSGPHGGGLAFDGTDDYIPLGNIPATLSNCTIIATINPTLSKIFFITSCGPSGTTSGLEFRVETTGALRFVKANAADIGLGTAGAVANGQFSHVAGTYDTAGNYKYYANGVPAGSGTNLQTITNPNVFLAVNTGEYSLGSISSVFIYNRALSAEEIAYLYAQPYCMFEDGVSPVELWRLPTIFTESLILSISSGLTRESTLSAMEAVALAVNAIESRSATTEMNAGLSLGIAAEQGTDKNLTASVLAELAAAVGVTSSGQSIIANALILQASASMIQASVGSLLASLNLDLSVGEEFGTALILQASVLLDAAYGLSGIGGFSLDDAASLGVNAGMAQTVAALLSAAVNLNAQASQAQSSVLTAEAQVALSIACGQIDTAFLESTNYVELSLSVVAGMQQWGIVPRIAAAKHLYNALARKREYDALARKREYDDQ